MASRYAFVTLAGIDKVGLHLCYDMELQRDAPEAQVAALVRELRGRVARLPLEAVSDVVRLTDAALASRPALHGFALRQLQDVAHINASAAREDLYVRRLGIDDQTRFERRGDALIYRAIEIPADIAAVAYGFGIAVGNGSEPASLGAIRIAPEGGEPSSWWWHCCCKTQYASVHGDEHLVRCHLALVTALEIARDLGFQITVRDETGYWESRDSKALIQRVGEMNRVIARFAGMFTDAARAAGADSRGIQGEIFKHPDFERLETPERGPDLP